MIIPVETSARHIHLSQEHVEALFGAGHQLTPRKELSQPGQYACVERCTIVGPKRSLENVSVLGPTRSASQIELSLTDARSIGVDAPVRESGDIAGSGACKLVGPAGEVELTEGVLVAKAHIHMQTQEAAAAGYTDKQRVSVAFGSNGRKIVLEDVVVRTGDNYALAMHIDTDESNAAGGAVKEGDIL